MSKGFASNYRVAVLTSLVLAAFGGIGARLVWLQVVAHDELVGSVEKVRREIIPSFARRGDILAAHGTLLATSRSVIELGVDPRSELPQDRRKWPELARLIGMPLDALEPLLLTRYRPAVAYGAPADPDQVLDDDDGHGRRPIGWTELCAALPESAYEQVDRLHISGVYGRRVYRRDYPNNELAAHVVGYVNHFEVPVAGIERYANFYLRGQNGWVESEKDGHQHELAQFRTREVPADDGYNVVLSIDAPVQRMAEDELKAIVEKFQPLKATIIISDPRSGFLLALANYPTFDLNRYNKLGKDEQGRMTNIALADVYEPGSVFKIVAAAGALNDGLVTPGTMFDCSLESIEYEGRVRPLPREDVSDRKYFVHPVSVSEIIAHSSNKGAAQLAMRLGDRRFFAYARAFGFGQKTGYPDGGEESRGILNPPEKWDGLTITRMPMGQAVAATPLQMHEAMSVIASGGVRLRPRVIQEIRDASNAHVYRFDRIEFNRVISESTARTMARMLQGVASPQGTAPDAAIPGFEVAGKTGTAQKVMPGGRGYSEHHHVASFVGFFPASNPRVVISVIVDDADAHTPGGTAYGTKVAAPSFHHLALELIPYLNIQAPLSEFPPGQLALEGGRR